MSALPTTIGRYLIRERLARGGMGVLDLALDPAIDRLIALKVLRVDSLDLQARFLREARLAARLQHPNIVTIYDVGEHEGQPFIAMEYIPGETLAEMIARRAPLSLGRKLALIEDVCRGLAFAHRHGVIHRDIKPANLMVSRDSGTLKVLDFGIARGEQSNLTQAGMLMGTPNYMAPEQVEGLPVDHRSDIFAVGLVLYELLVYRRAFPGETQPAVLYKILHEAPPPVTSLEPDVDPAVVSIVERALAKAPGSRYQDLETMRGDLSRIAQRLDFVRSGTTGVIEPAQGHAPTPSGAITADRHTHPQTPLSEGQAERVKRHVESADGALAADDLDSALREADLASELAPQDSRVISLLKRVQIAQAERDLAHCLEDAQRELAAGALSRASQLVQMALNVSPHDPRVQQIKLELDRAFDERGRRRERARQMHRALDQAREAAQAGLPEAALRAVNEALSYDPQHAEALALRQQLQGNVEALADDTLARPPAAAPVSGSAPTAAKPAAQASGAPSGPGRALRAAVVLAAVVVLAVGAWLILGFDISGLKRSGAQVTGLKTSTGEKGPDQNGANRSGPNQSGANQSGANQSGADKKGAEGKGVDGKPNEQAGTDATGKPGDTNATATTSDAPRDGKEGSVPPGTSTETTAVGNLVIDAAPWARVERIERVRANGVEVVGSADVTPLSLTLPVGEYRIQLERNGVRRTRNVSVAERSTRSVLVTFERVDAAQFLAQAQP